jgi:Na+-driven multidrug efflux pump
MINNARILYFRLLLNALLGLLITRKLVDSFGISEYGLYSLVASVVLTLTFLNTVMVSTTFRFISIEIGKGQGANVCEIFNTSVRLHFLLGIVLCLLIEFIGVIYLKDYATISSSKIHLAISVLRYSNIGVFFMMLSIPYQALLTAHERFDITGAIEVTMTLLKLIAIYYLTYLGNASIDTYAASTSGVLFFAFVLYTFNSVSLFGSDCKLKYKSIGRRYKEMAIFTGWISLGAISSIAKIHVSSILINVFFSVMANAAWAIANQFYALMSMVAKGVTQAIAPRLTKALGSGDQLKALELAAYSAKYAMLITIPPVFVLILNIDFFLNLWLSKVPENSGVLSKLLMLCVLIESGNAGISNLILANGDVKEYVFITGSIALISLPITAFLYSKGCDLRVIGIVYLCSSLLVSITQAAIVKRLMNIDILEYYRKAYGKLIFVLLALVLYVVGYDYFIIDIKSNILNIFSAVIWSYLTIFFIGLSSDERVKMMHSISFSKSGKSLKGNL